LALIDPSKITPRDGLIAGVVLIIMFWLWHDFVILPDRMIKQLCERADVLDPEKIDEDVRTALDEMTEICRGRRPIEE
jgi:hypothetical protein